MATTIEPHREGRTKEGRRKVKRKGSWIIMDKGRRNNGGRLIIMEIRIRWKRH